MAHNLLAIQLSVGVLLLDTAFLPRLVQKLKYEDATSKRNNTDMTGKTQRPGGRHLTRSKLGYVIPDVYILPKHLIKTNHSSNTVKVSGLLQNRGSDTYNPNSNAIIFSFLETGSHCITLIVLELALCKPVWPKLSLPLPPESWD